MKFYRMYNDGHPPPNPPKIKVITASHRFLWSQGQSWIQTRDAQSTIYPLSSNSRVKTGLELAIIGVDDE